MGLSQPWIAIGRALPAAAAALLASALAHAEYPEHPIRLIVPQAAGSSTDTGARSLANSLAPEVGQPIVVDNRPGGAFTIGMDAVAKAPGDGYTVGLAPIGALAINRSVLARLPYEPDRDLQPVSQVAFGHLLLAVYPGRPSKPSASSWITAAPIPVSCSTPPRAMGRPAMSAPSCSS